MRGSIVFIFLAAVAAQESKKICASEQDLYRIIATLPELHARAAIDNYRLTSRDFGRSGGGCGAGEAALDVDGRGGLDALAQRVLLDLARDRKSTRLNSSHQ